MFHDLHDSTDTSDLYTMPAESFRKWAGNTGNMDAETLTAFVPFVVNPSPGGHNI